MTRFLYLENGKLYLRSTEAGAPTGTVQEIASVTELRAIVGDDEIFCSSDLDFPGDQTDDPSVIALCEELRDAPQPGHLWEMVEDRCAVCGVLIGIGVRFMHLSLCEACRDGVKH